MPLEEKGSASGWIKVQSLKNIAPHILYILIILLIEHSVIGVFLYLGLRDPAPLTFYLWENAPLLSISILLHLIPLNTALVLLLCWIYLVKYTFKMPSKTLGSKPSVSLRIAGKAKPSIIVLKPLWVVLKGYLNVILPFSFILFTLFALTCPSATYDFVANLYWRNKYFRGFIEWTSQVNSSLIGSIGSFAVAFRSIFWALISPLSETILRLDIVWKYLICQNFAAWLVAILVLIYVWNLRRR